ncbi:Uncharacterized protein TCM_015813 [Theobroma cacao]|uniref:Uncharacterized protein n=1 Tax=Theobroma cacao TaxID=3641 RepID=A0A061G2Q5_THECC|nr:Uncharacterized protein TCM_015813 [Theobroma cacao]
MYCLKVKMFKPLIKTQNHSVSVIGKSTKKWEKRSLSFKRLPPPLPSPPFLTGMDSCLAESLLVKNWAT